MKRFRDISDRIGQRLIQITQRYPRLVGRDMKRMLIDLNSIPEAQPLATELQALLIKRVEILKNASMKGEALKKIFEDNDLKRCIVYCNDIDHVRQSIDILHGLNVNCREYDSEMTRDERQII